MNPGSRLSTSQKVALRNLWGRGLDQVARPVSGDLDRLARLFGTDKASTGHGYTKFYARHLPPRKPVTSLLEIGVGGTTSKTGYKTPFGGQSLRMWQRYYPHAQIVGIDLEPKSVGGPRIAFERGSQDDAAFLEKVAAEYGPFDVVIDDGSHIGRHVSASFASLFEHLKPGGVYVVEDLATAYDPGWEGGPPGTPGTQSELIKTFVDDVLRAHWDADSNARAISGLHLYDEIVFIDKTN